MATADDVLKIAEGELYYAAYDDPEPGSKYGRWLASKWNESWLSGPSSEIWWCCLFVSWCLDRAGQQCAGFPTYNTDLALNGGARNLLVDRGDIRRGDIIIFDWDWNGATDHIGFATGAISGGVFPTLEGNISNSVKRLTRNLNNVAYVIRPPYAGSTPQPKPDPKAELVVDGWLGEKSITKWQDQMRTQVDGVVSGQWRGNQDRLERLVSVDWDASGSSLVKAIQRKLGGLQVDGILGEKSIKKLQKFVGVEADGYIGPVTSMAIQKSLNMGKFK